MSDIKGTIIHNKTYTQCESWVYFSVYPEYIVFPITQVSDKREVLEQNGLRYFLKYYWSACMQVTSIFFWLEEDSICSEKIKPHVSYSNKVDPEVTQNHVSLPY